jgi:putative transcriptional regulator
MNRIKVILEEKQMTQVELNNRLEKSYNMVNSYVQNRRQPSIELLYKIADLLEVSVKELLIEKK